MTTSLNRLAGQLGIQFFPYQESAFTWWYSQHSRESARACLYYRTGAGKSITALVMMKLFGYHKVVVIAPPATHSAWKETAAKIGVRVETISHAKFRQQGFKLSRDVPVIADEFHLFGGHGGKGWKKFDRLAQGLQAPIILASATPNYNDADRVYCIQRILDPASTKGGFLEFLYRHCTTEQNPFGMMPIVTGFQKFKDAEEYLASLPGVYYLPDDLVYTIHDVYTHAELDRAYTRYGYDARTHRVVASMMEDRHKRIANTWLYKSGEVKPSKMDLVDELLARSTGPVLVYADHSTLAEAVYDGLAVRSAARSLALVTGKTTLKKKDFLIDEFRRGEIDVLIGTASLATGTDGLDKVCDTLIILDDTDDDSLRRQLIGRIMPRGADSDASKKQVIRVVPQFS